MFYTFFDGLFTQYPWLGLSHYSPDTIGFVTAVFCALVLLLILYVLLWRSKTPVTEHHLSEAEKDLLDSYYPQAAAAQRDEQRRRELALVVGRKAGNRG